MAEAAVAYLREAYPDRDIPDEYDVLVNAALRDMEENRPSTEQEYLLKLRAFAKLAEDFVREKKIATIPKNQTLSIELAPESAGPSARIGYVRPAPSFSPNPWTTRENPHPVRILFPYGLYSEGWATLCERVALEAGWDNGNKLTLLAPQFAKSLWGRLMRSPMQITSYFLGYKKFDEIYEFSAIFATRQN